MLQELVCSTAWYLVFTLLLMMHERLCSIWLIFAWMSWPVAIGGVSAAQARSHAWADVPVSQMPRGCIAANEQSRLYVHHPPTSLLQDRCNSGDGQTGVHTWSYLMGGPQISCVAFSPCRNPSELLQATRRAFSMPTIHAAIGQPQTNQLHSLLSRSAAVQITCALSPLPSTGASASSGLTGGRSATTSLSWCGIQLLRSTVVYVVHALPRKNASFLCVWSAL